MRYKVPWCSVHVCKTKLIPLYYLSPVHRFLLVPLFLHLYLFMFRFMYLFCLFACFAACF